MTVVAKCNITLSAIKKLSNLYWGLEEDKEVELKVLENYAEYLACPDIDLTICHGDNCSNPTIVMNCVLKVASIQSSIIDTTVRFFVNPTDVTGGKTPYTYEWDYDIDDFINISSPNSPEVTLTPKIGKKLSLIVSIISLRVTDANGCETIKHCYFTPQGMKCASGYIACDTVGELVIINKNISCAGVSGLIVSNKN